MDEDVRVADFLTTAKQRAFESDFFKDAETYERWEDVDFEGVHEMDRTFTVEVEDITSYSEGILDGNPLFNDAAAAQAGPYGGLIAHPLFLTPVAFWLTGDQGPGSWVRTPGAINPGQKIEFFQHIRPGDTIRAQSRFHDKWVKRGKRYLTYRTEYHNQRDELVATWWGTLILPRSQGEAPHAF